MSGNPFQRPLDEIAESVRNVDLYERSLRRSRQIGRRRAAAVSGAALVVLGLAGAGLFMVPPDPDLPPPVIASPTSPLPSAASSASPSRSAPTTPPGKAVPRSRSLSALPGRVFYRTGENQVVRLTADGKRTTVLEAPHETVAVSPSGDRIAYVVDGKLKLSGSDFAGTVDADQIPAWSPDGAKLLIAAPDPGVLTVSTGVFTKLPKSLGGKNFRWSGDGTRLIYGTSSCRLKIADAAGTSGRTVPGIGDPETARNPDGSAVCRPVSADRAGGRITAPLVSVGSDGGYPVADTIVDTATGEVLPVPVTGRVDGALFGPDGNLLIRTSDSTLYVFAPDGTLLVQAREPAALQNMELLAYTD